MAWEINSDRPVYIQLMEEIERRINMLFEFGRRSRGITGLFEYLHITFLYPSGRSSQGMSGIGLPTIFNSLFICLIVLFTWISRLHSR